MAFYNTPPPHERLNFFFSEFFREIRKAPPEIYGNFFVRAEEEFKRLGYREKIPSGVENILIVRLDSIGDMILTSGFIREVRRNFPKANITLVIFPTTYQVVKLCPYVNEIFIVERDWFAKNFLELFESAAVFCRDNLWQKKFSIAFSPRWASDTFSSLLLNWLSGARERIGYGTFPHKSWVDNPPPAFEAQDNFFLTKNIVTPKNIIHDAEKNFYLLEAVGLKVNQTNLELFYGEADFLSAKEMLEDIPQNCKKVLLGIGGQELNKHYPVDKYLVALRELAKKNLFFIIVGGQAEINEAAYLERNLPHGKVLNLVGKTTLREAEALSAQADFYIGNDTGNLHIAAAAKVPCLVLYRDAADKLDFCPGMFNPSRRFAPYQTKSIILRPEHQLEECAKLPPIDGWCHARVPHCITQITPQQIIEGFEALESL